MRRLCTESWSFDVYDEISSFPAVRLWPIEREVDAFANAQAWCLDVHHMDAQGRVACGEIVHCAPAISGPMQDCGVKRLDAQGPARRHCPDLVVEAPDDTA